MEVRTGLPQPKTQAGGGRLASGCHLDQSKHPGATQGNACLRANQTLPEITSKPLKRMSECLRRGMCLRRAGGGEPELGGREEGEAGGPLGPVDTPSGGCEEYGDLRHEGSWLCLRVLGFGTPCQTLQVNSCPH